MNSEQIFDLEGPEGTVRVKQRADGKWLTEPVDQTRSGATSPGHSSSEADDAPPVSQDPLAAEYNRSGDATTEITLDQLADELDKLSKDVVGIRASGATIFGWFTIVGLIADALGNALGQATGSAALLGALGGVGIEGHTNKTAFMAVWSSQLLLYVLAFWALSISPWRGWIQEALRSAASRVVQCGLYALQRLSGRTTGNDERDLPPIGDMLCLAAVPPVTLGLYRLGIEVPFGQWYTIAAIPLLGASAFGMVIVGRAVLQVMLKDGPKSILAAAAALIFSIVFTLLSDETAASGGATLASQSFREWQFVLAILLSIGVLVVLIRDWRDRIAFVVSIRGPSHKGASVHLASLIGKPIRERVARFEGDVSFVIWAREPHLSSFRALDPYRVWVLNRAEYRIWNLAALKLLSIPVGGVDGQGGTTMQFDMKWPQASNWARRLRTSPLEPEIIEWFGGEVLAMDALQGRFTLAVKSQLARAHEEFKDVLRQATTNLRRLETNLKSALMSTRTVLMDDTRPPGPNLLATLSSQAERIEMALATNRAAADKILDNVTFRKAGDVWRNSFMSAVNDEVRRHFRETLRVELHDKADILLGALVAVTNGTFLESALADTELRKLHEIAEELETKVGEQVTQLAALIQEEIRRVQAAMELEDAKDLDHQRTKELAAMSALKDIVGRLRWNRTTSGILEQLLGIATAEKAGPTKVEATALKSLPQATGHTSDQTSQETQRPNRSNVKDERSHD